ncbi:Protein of unknown function [Gryllus bimaculatus]|nr:Protein of unknown function [Gryllus bimaculatus]
MAPVTPTAAAGGVPLEYSVVDPSQGELDALICRYFMPGFRKGYVRVGPHRALLPLYYLEHARAYHDMAVRDQDVYVVSHPKAGILKEAEPSSSYYAIIPNGKYPRSRRAAVGQTRGKVTSDVSNGRLNAWECNQSWNKQRTLLRET